MLFAGRVENRGCRRSFGFWRGQENCQANSVQSGAWLCMLLGISSFNRSVMFNVQKLSVSVLSTVRKFGIVAPKFYPKPLFGFNITVTCVSEAKDGNWNSFVSSLIKTCECRVGLQCQLLTRPYPIVKQSLTVNTVTWMTRSPDANGFFDRNSKNLRLRQCKCFVSNFARAVCTGSVVQLLSRMDSRLKTSTQKVAGD